MSIHEEQNKTVTSACHRVNDCLACKRDLGSTHRTQPCPSIIRNSSIILQKQYAKRKLHRMNPRSTHKDKWGWEGGTVLCGSKSLSSQLELKQVYKHC